MSTRRQLSWRAALPFISFFAVSFLLLSYATFFHRSHLTPRASAIDGDLEDNVVAHLAKRATATYEDAREKGHKLHCLMGMSEADAKAANRGVSLEAPIWAQTDAIGELEGWVNADEDRRPDPFFSTYLNDALRDLGIEPEFHHSLWAHLNRGHIFEDPTRIVTDEEDWGDFVMGQPCEASMQNSFIIDPGVVIADKNLGVTEAKRERLIQEPPPTTHIQKWSDVAWIQWTQACEWYNGDVANVRYIIRSWITNHFTLSIVFQALINKDKRDGRGKIIGRWADRITLTVRDNPDEFHAILGSPNGSGSAYFLINHKQRMGVKIINKVDIFVPLIPLEVTGTSVNGFHEERKVMLLFHVTDV
ncbi:hypothetical protein LCI18_011235 [Fusarium solani-melongenae]|uniref:Uncharacterized protein n=1 Tax=Fusarium solani subsp. cucurbitae TaxID=2747967 RepID=A0ACD3ZGS4_FUSSC|nr:hypothetical protein LCI18_011235 [Fusarium solani-melongenae]